MFLISQMAAWLLIRKYSRGYVFAKPDLLTKFPRKLYGTHVTINKMAVDT